MKQDLNIEEWNGIQEKTRRWNREHGVTPQMQARIDAARTHRPLYDQAMIQRAHMALRMMRFGRKAPTAAELKAQWLEQQRHEAEIRQRFTTAERI